MRDSNAMGIVLMGALLLSGCSDGGPVAVTNTEPPSTGAESASSISVSPADPLSSAEASTAPSTRAEIGDPGQPSPTQVPYVTPDDETTINDKPPDEPPGPPPTQSPTPPAERIAHLGEEFTLTDGETVRVDGLEVTLLQAVGPSDACADCPIQADVRVTDGSGSRDLSFSFSGNMAPAAEEEARTEEAFGRTFRAERIDQRQLDLVVS